MAASTPSRRRRLPLPVMAVTALVFAALLVLGVWVAGGVLTNDFKASVVLLTVWMAAAGVAALVVGLRRRELRLPLWAPYVVVAVVAAVWLGRAELFDKTVDEDVVMADPVPQPSRSREGPTSARPRNVLVARGSFDSLEHPSSGVARVIDAANGKRYLTLTDFSTSNGPDLRVYLAAGPVDDAGDVDDFADLGGLKGNKGNQQYEIDAKARNPRYRTVVIWCRAFSVAFARARLSRAS